MPNQGDGGMLAAAPNPHRYEGHTLNPHEASGLVASLVPEGARLLDVGCGSGGITELLRDVRSARVVGVEPDPLRAAHARERGIEVHEGVLSPSLAATLGTFDVVLYADVLEHLVDPLGELEKVAQLLAPNGVLIISVPNVAHWSVRVNLLRGRFNYAPTGIMDATHLRWFTSKTLLELLKRAGFTLVQVKHSSGGFLPCYRSTILSRIPARLRRAAIRRLITIAPTLFACQFVMVLGLQDLMPSRQDDRQSSESVQSA